MFDLQPWSRLSDQSYAGYNGNRAYRPIVNNVANVKDFGAKGDGRTDDTAAIQRAINAAGMKRGAAYMPPGVYVVSRKLMITTSRTVLRGAGQNKTTIFISKSLEEVYGRSGKIDRLTSK